MKIKSIILRILHSIIIVLFIMTNVYGSTAQMELTPFDTVHANGNKFYRTNEGKLSFYKEKQMLFYENNSDTYMFLKGAVAVGNIYNNSIIIRDTTHQFHMLKVDYLNRLDPDLSLIKTTDIPIFQVLSFDWDDVGLGRRMVRGFNNRTAETVFITPNGEIGATLHEVEESKVKRSTYKNGWAIEFGTNFKIRDRLGWNTSKLDDKSTVKLNRIIDSSKSRKEQLILVTTYKKMGLISYKKHALFKDSWKVIIDPSYDTIMYEKDAKGDLNLLLINRSFVGKYYPQFYNKDGYRFHNEPEKVRQYLDSLNLQSLIGWQDFMDYENNLIDLKLSADSTYLKGDYIEALKQYEHLQKIRTSNELNDKIALCNKLIELNFDAIISNVSRTSDYSLSYTHVAIGKPQVAYAFKNTVLKGIRHSGELPQRIKIDKINDLEYNVSLELDPNSIEGNFLFISEPTESERLKQVKKNKIEMKLEIDQIEESLMKLSGND